MRAKIDRIRIQTTVPRELHEQFIREAYHRSIPQSQLLEEMLRGRYRDPKDRFPPVPANIPDLPKDEWRTRDLSKCEY